MKEDQRTKLLDAAERLLAFGGKGRVSVRTLVKEAGLHSAAVNYHFGSKQKLLDAVFARRLSPLADAQFQRLQGTLDSLTIDSFVRAYVEPALELNTEAASLVALALSEPNAFRRGRQSKVFTSFEKALRSLGLSGHIPRLGFVFLHGALIGALVTAGSNTGWRHKRRVTVALTSFAVGGLATLRDLAGPSFGGCLGSKQGLPLPVDDPADEGSTR